jgi:hypothetical protein
LTTESRIDAAYQGEVFHLPCLSVKEAEEIGPLEDRKVQPLRTWAGTRWMDSAKVVNLPGLQAVMIIRQSLGKWALLQQFR